MSLPSKVGAFLRKNAPEPVFGIAKSIYQFVMRPGKLTCGMDYWRVQAITIAPKYHPNPYAGHMGLSEDDKPTGARVLWYVGRNSVA